MSDKPCCACKEVRHYQIPVEFERASTQEKLQGFKDAWYCVDCNEQFTKSRFHEPVVKQLNAEIERMQKLLSVAVCPECDGSGTKTIAGPYHEGEAVRCQWCAEVAER